MHELLLFLFDVPKTGFGFSFALSGYKHFITTAVCGFVPVAACRGESPAF